MPRLAHFRRSNAQSGGVEDAVSRKSTGFASWAWGGARYRREGEHGRANRCDSFDGLAAGWATTRLPRGGLAARSLGRKRWCLALRSFGFSIAGNVPPPLWMDVHRSAPGALPRDMGT